VIERGNVYENDWCERKREWELEWWVINFKDNVKRIIGKKCKREC
jgi:hypothetical protein